MPLKLIFWKVNALVEGDANIQTTTMTVNYSVAAVAFPYCICLQPTFYSEVPRFMFESILYGKIMWLRSILYITSNYTVWLIHILHLPIINRSFVLEMQILPDLAGLLNHVRWVKIITSTAVAVTQHTQQLDIF